MQQPTLSPPLPHLLRWVAINPLQGLEHLPFEVAVDYARRHLGAEGLLDLAEYRRLFGAGRISGRDVAEVLRIRFPDSAGQGLLVGRRRIPASGLLWLHQVYGWDDGPAGSAGRARSGPPRLHPDLPRGLRVRLCRRLQEAGGGRASRVDDPERRCAGLLWTAARERAARFRFPEPSPRGAGTAGRREGPAPPVLEPPVATRGEWCQTVTGVAVPERVNQELIKWCAAFLDEGQAAWPMPYRERGFYRAWKTLAVHDRSLAALGIVTFSRQLQALPAEPEDAILGLLRGLEVPERQWTAYLRRHLVQLPGWAGFIRWHAEQTGPAPAGAGRMDLVQYLAVRLFYEAVLVRHLCPRPAGPAAGGARAAGQAGPESPSPPDPGLRLAGLLFYLAQFLTLSPGEVGALPDVTVHRLLRLTGLLPPERRRWVWQEAYEAGYRRRLLRQLADAAPAAGGVGDSRPPAQVVFCIDSRSEGLRRHLESRGAYETLGTAGFFGVPMWFRPLDSGPASVRCPAPVKPRLLVEETPAGGSSRRLRRRQAGGHWLHALSGVLGELKANLVTPYPLIEAIGAGYVVPLVLRTLWPRGYHALQAGLRRRLLPEVATVPRIYPAERSGPEAAGPDGGPRPGAAELPVARQVEVVRDALRAAGMTRRFAPLVALIGHGSASENNPYAAALACGACGGQAGGPNARVLAALANRPAVRAGLRAAGMAIPDDTWFVAGEHDTTTDAVRLFGLETLPPAWRGAAARLQQDLTAAAAGLARERLARLPGAPAGMLPRPARRYAARRGRDGAEVQPEWGQARNAALLIADRHLTRARDLEGRCFLQSYDADRDPDGRVLEGLLGGPLVVAAWINLQYYFSSVDNRGYGSGSKALHNVVGGFGVMQGNRGDLERGLPLQSVMDGPARYHEPLRLLTVVAAPRERIEGALRRQERADRLCRNGWVTLVASDPLRGEFHRYRRDGGWDPLPVGVRPTAARV
ncbi:conserved protein of unknown function [Candidatus Hydrogenisulfobacillus filiaventi]|uniref:Probable inorganic carbon transporter subunit DabA n=1 Tax=Candidatus Hydrogenisulfobacillus filiaventi TaxID=2707344 RepID=A0A6F8ZHH2_9FIRM|nr:conserved protein of unknown function [Candidatus Hydrogenisulfobacillus filiaventi]